MENKFYLINTSPKYGENILKSFRYERDVILFLLNADAPSRYKLVQGSELKFKKKTTVEICSGEESNGY